MAFDSELLMSTTVTLKGFSCIAQTFAQNHWTILFQTTLVLKHGATTYCGALTTREETEDASSDAVNLNAQ